MTKETERAEFEVQIAALRRCSVEYIRRFWTGHVYSEGSIDLAYGLWKVAIKRFLNTSGQYITNDASRQAAIADAIERDRQRHKASVKESAAVQIVAELAAIIPLKDTLKATQTGRTMVEYFKGLVDCQGLGEAVAWINEDELPNNYPYDEMYPFSKVDVVRLFPVFFPETVITTSYLDGHNDGLEWAAQLAEANHPLTSDWLYDDPHDLAKAIRKGPEMPEAAPQTTTPTVKDSLTTDIMPVTPEEDEAWAKLERRQIHGWDSS
ncbi:hypothetical protein ACMHYO_14075 [Allopusillimonas ginsengisoli]|uniref:hypothetical protein n=1 Tax=Allopusillimonas ginsengisoli TaxID=453575 RepID=UPI0039C1898C